MGEPVSGEIQKTSIKLDPTGEKRAAYLDRRATLEKHFLDHPPKTREREFDYGARIRVLSSLFEFPEALKKESDTYRLTVFVPGLFDASKPNYGNHPLEVKLAGALLTGEADAVMMLKAEGLNAFAYQENGRGCVEKRVSEAAFEVLRERIQAVAQAMGKPVELRILGYSEGSTQGASIAALAVESHLGKVSEYVSIGGGGLAGASTQEGASPLKAIRANLLKVGVETQRAEAAAREKGSEIVQEGPDTFYIDSKVIGDKKSGGLEEALGRATVDPIADITNVAIWAKRFVETELGAKDEVPWERLQAIWTVNPDYEVLVKNEVPLTVFSGTADVCFTNSEVRGNVQRLREHGGKVLLVSSNVGHDFPHKNPSGVAFILEALKQKIGA